MKKTNSIAAKISLWKTSVVSVLLDSVQLEVQNESSQLFQTKLWKTLNSIKRSDTSALTMPFKTSDYYYNYYYCYCQPYLFQ